MLNLFKRSNSEKGQKNISINLNEQYIIDYSSILNLPELLTSIREQTATSLNLNNQELIDYSGKAYKEQLLTSDTEINTLTIVRSTILRDTFIVYSGEDSKIYVWSLNEKEIVRVLTGHEAKINVIKLLSNGQVVSAAKDNTIRIWELHSGTCKQVIKGKEYPKYGAYDISILRNNTLATIHFWDYEELTFDRRIYLWDSISGELIKVLPCPDVLAREQYLSLRIAAISEERFAVSYSNREKSSICIWNSRDYTYEILGNYQSTSPICSLVAPPNNKLAIGSSLGGFIKCQNSISIYNLLDGEIKTWAIPSGESFRRLKVLSDGSIASVMGDGEINIWDTCHISQCLSALNGVSDKGFFNNLFANDHNIFDVLPDGKLVTSCGSRQLQCWNFPLRAIQKAEIIQVLDALRVNHSVTSINLSGLPLDDKAAELLTEILLKHPALQTVDLRGSEISKENLEKLVSACHQVTRIIDLHFSAACQYIQQSSTSDTKILDNQGCSGSNEQLTADSLGRALNSMHF